MNNHQWMSELQTDLEALRGIAWPGTGKGILEIANFLHKWEQTIWELAQKNKGE